MVLLQTKFDSASQKSKDILLKASSAAANGDFSFEDLPIAGAFKLNISAVGFAQFEQAVSFRPSGPPGGAAPAGMPSFDKDLGKIVLQADHEQLESVTVTASAPTLKMDIDKKTFNVEKNIVSAGGTAVDVMRNVPSVQVDIDGNVKLRNATRRSISTAGPPPYHSTRSLRMPYKVWK